MELFCKEFDKDTIKELRNVQLRLLNEFVKICNKHNLTYWLDYGTLLGAVRHKGYIPWDDDIDVGLPIKDYNKFLKIAKIELPRDIFLQTNKTDKNYRPGDAKLRDCYSTYIEYEETENPGYHQGIFIDIFRYTEYPKLPFRIKQHIMNKTLKIYIKRYINKTSDLLDIVQNSLYQAFWGLSLFINKGGELAAPLGENYFKAIHPYSSIFPLSSVEFEGNKYNAPGKYERYLNTIYGDYLQLPPVEERRFTHARIILPGNPCKHPRAINRNLH